MAFLDPLKALAASLIVYFSLKASRSRWKKVILLLIASGVWVLLSSWLFAELGVEDIHMHSLASIIWIAVFLVPLWRRQIRRDAIINENELVYGRL